MYASNCSICLIECSVQLRTVLNYFNDGFSVIASGWLPYIYVILPLKQTTILAGCQGVTCRTHVFIILKTMGGCTNSHV